MWLTVLQIWYPFKLLEPKATQKSQINFFNIGLKWGTHFREKSSLYGTETLSSVNLWSPDTNMDILWNCICFSTCGKFQSFGLILVDFRVGWEEGGNTNQFNLPVLWVEYWSEIGPRRKKLNLLNKMRKLDFMSRHFLLSWRRPFNSFMTEVPII